MAAALPLASPTHIHKVKMASLAVARATIKGVVTDEPQGRKIGRFTVIDGGAN